MTAEWEEGGIVWANGEGIEDAFALAAAYHPASGDWVVLVRIAEYAIPLTPDQASRIAAGLVECAIFAQSRAGTIPPGAPPS